MQTCCSTGSIGMREREEIKKHGLEGGWKEAKIDGGASIHGGKQGGGEEDTESDRGTLVCLLPC